MAAEDQYRRALARAAAMPEQDEERRVVDLAEARRRRGLTPYAVPADRERGEGAGGKEEKA